MPNSQPTAAVADQRTEIGQILEAREKGRAALSKANGDREAQNAELVKSFAKQAGSADVDPARALDLYKQWKTRDTQAAERIEALEELLARTDAYVAGLKATQRAELAAALTSMIQKLTDQAGAHHKEDEQLQERVQRLQKELDQIGSPETRATEGAGKSRRPHNE